MSDEIRYRALVPPDAERVADLIRTAFAAQTLVTDPLPSALRVTASDVDEHLTHGGGGALAEAGRFLAGSALWVEKDCGLYIARVATLPGWRRRGIARHFLTLAEAGARAKSLPRLWLETRLALHDNRRLFASVGFVEVSLHTHPGYAAPTFVRMEKTLTGSG